MGRFTLLSLKVGVVAPPQDQPDAPVGLVVYDETRTWGTLDVTQEQWSTLALALTGTTTPRLPWSGPMGPVDVTLDHAIAAEESIHAGEQWEGGGALWALTQDESNAIVMGEQPEPWLPDVTITAEELDAALEIEWPDEIVEGVTVDVTPCIPCHTGLGGKCEYPVALASGGTMCACPCALCRYGDPVDDAIADEWPEGDTEEGEAMGYTFEPVEGRYTASEPNVQSFTKLTPDEIARLRKARVIKPEDDEIASKLRSFLGNPFFMVPLLCECGTDLATIGWPVPTNIECVTCNRLWRTVVTDGVVTLTLKG